MTPPLITADQVSVSAGHTVLLPPVSFQVQPGQTLVITGENGSGKTTLLRVLAGLTPATAGAVLFGGAPPDERRTDFRALLAAALGTPPLAQNLTIREHLMLVSVSWGADLTQAESQADELLDDLQITALASRYAHELSSGQLQLFTLALPLARTFQVLVVDEPEQRLDPGRLELVSHRLRQCVAAGATLVLATHSRWLADSLADQRVALAARP